MNLFLRPTFREKASPGTCGNGLENKLPQEMVRRVTEHSKALALENQVFKRSPREIAQSLKRSAEHSRRRKTTPYRSAMSMLTFYINRAGKNLSAARRRKLEAAKGKLREAFGRKD
jgi:hypothetical protein